MPTSHLNIEERKEYTGATEARVRRCFDESAARPLVLLVRQEEPPRQRKGALGAH